jgi:type VI secretion system Hcp family effector
MALDADIKVVGSVQGAFAHQSAIKSRQGTSIVMKSAHGIFAPRDQSSGLNTGKRCHKEMDCTVLLDSSIVNFYSAISLNEVLKTVTINFYQTAASTLNIGGTAAAGGEGKPAVTWLLENAVVSELDFFQPFSRAVEAEEKHKDQHFRVKFTYQKVTVTWTVGGKTYVDDWTAVS